MASEDDIIRIIGKFEGEEEAKKLAAQVALAEQKFKALYETLGAGNVATKAAAGQLADLNAQMKAAGGGAGNVSQLLMQAGYAADDLQFGFKGISNNIQPILQSIPGLGAMAPILSIAAIAAYQLWEHSGQIADLFGMGHTKSEAEKMEELGKQTSKTAEETAKLLRYEELRANIKAQGAKPEARTEFSMAINRAFAEGPLEDVDKGLDKHFKKRIQAMADVQQGADDPRLDGQLATAKKYYDYSVKARGVNHQDTLDYKKELDDLGKKKEAFYGNAREKFRGEAATNPDRAREIEKAARDHPGDFGPGGRKFADHLGGALDPGGKASEEQARRADLDSKEAEKKLKEGRDKAARDEVKQARDADVDSKQAEELAKKARDKKAADSTHQARDADADSKEAEAKYKHDRDKAGGLSVEKALAGTGSDARTEDAFLRNSLKAGGNAKLAADLTAMQIKRELMGKGVSEDQAEIASRKMAEDQAAKTGDDLTRRRMEGKPGEPPRAPEHVGVADFARSVESQGAADQKKMLSLTEQMKDQLTTLVGFGRPVARAGR